MEDEIAQQLLDTYASNECTLWLTPRPPSGVAVEVSERQVFSSLREAVDGIVADAAKHGFYEIQIHQNGPDIPVTTQQLEALVSFVRRSP